MSLLASLRPAATTETNLYTVPVAKKAVVNLTINNVSGSIQSLVRVGIQDAAGAFAAEDYILYDYPLTPNTLPIQITGIALTAGQSIRVYSGVGTVNYHVNGIVETA